MDNENALNLTCHFRRKGMGSQFGGQVFRCSLFSFVGLPGASDSESVRIVNHNRPSEVLRSLAP